MGAGGGFPDVSLLEPLADALHCSVVSLLEGRLVEEPAEIDVRSALTVLIRESRSALRRDWSRRFGILCCLLMAGFVIFEILDRSGAFLQKVERAYTVGIWQNGEKIGETAVTISGKKHLGTELRWAVCHRRSGENLSGTHAGNDPLGEEKQLRQYHIC